MNDLARDNALTLGACPLIVLATDIDHATGISLAMVIACVFAGLTVALLRVVTRGDIGLPAFAVVLATAVGVAGLALAAWRYPLYRPIAAALPLVIANVAWLTLCRERPLAAAWNIGLVGCVVLAFGFLRNAPISAGLTNVVATPAGAFLLLGLAVAVRQIIHRRVSKAFA